MRLCIVAENLFAPWDEGRKVFTYHLTKALSRNNPVLTLSPRGDGTEDDHIESLKSNKLFLNYSLLRKLEDFSPQAILYVPSASATLMSFLRSETLKFCSRRAKVVMVALQPRQYSSVTRRLIGLLGLDLVLVQSESFRKRLLELGCNAELVPGGVDIERFHPVDRESKGQLRRKHGIDTRKFLVLHVGHINRNRGVGALKEIQNGKYQTLLIGRTSVRQDPALTEELKEGGVRILTRYIENMEEIYQLSDCYLLPVLSETASIEIPLSVLEAMACNLPVVATRYGGLPNTFKEGNGFFFADRGKEMVEKIGDARRLKNVSTRALAEPFAWEKVSRVILKRIEALGNCL